MITKMHWVPWVSDIFSTSFTGCGIAIPNDDIPDDNVEITCKRCLSHLHKAAREELDRKEKRERQHIE